MLAPSGLTKLEDILTIGHALFCTDHSEVWAIDKLFEEAVFPASSSPPAILSPLVTDSEMGEKMVEVMMRLMTRLVNSKKEANSRQILGI